MAGGKLTGYRKMAEKLLDDVSKTLAKETGKKYKTVQTKHLPISGGDIGGSEQLEAFLSKKAKEGNNRFGWTLEEGREMAKRFGSNIDQLFTYAQEHKEQNETTLPNSLYAELRYWIQHEAVTTPIDFYYVALATCFSICHTYLNGKTLLWMKWLNNSTGATM